MSPGWSPAGGALRYFSAGIAAGAISTIIYAHLKHWTAIVPTTAWAGGLAAASSSAPWPATINPSCSRLNVFTDPGFIGV